jgi:hypothetical protein
MRTIETTVNVTEDGTLTISLPPDVTPGLHRVVVVIEGLSSVDEELDDFPLHDIGGWPADLPLKREDLYDDRGR